jgi:hypothetical protein
MIVRLNSNITSTSRIEIFDFKKRKALFVSKLLHVMVDNRYTD